ncbi:hypothetical protein QR680_003251 [Steinernema hermaphroditum]|uniref:Peroxidase n=1 Tax=Steinernema hermaphroditum TaxID=289476 RepID=A0AA39H6W8_9BILA|nr:hypothetical protein QR680_003251 [Steinernema hermaphroditum]
MRGSSLILLFMLLGGSLSNDDDHARLRRSNFPCGKSFTPCQRTAAFGVTSNTIDAIDEDRLESFQESPQKANIMRDLTRIATSEAIREAAQAAKDSVDRLFNSTERLMQRTTNVQDFAPSSLAWADITKMDKYAKDITYSSLISISTTQRLKNLGLTGDQIAVGLPEMPVIDTAVQAVCPVNLIVDCIPGKYRTYSGHCNNVNNPLKGAVYEPLQRLQKADYADDVSLPRASQKGEKLPSPRQITAELFTPPDDGHTECSLMIAQWAQFVHSDLSHIGSNRLFVGDQAIMLPCCDPNTRHPECLSIPIPENDPVFKGSSTCMTFSRSYTAPRENCTLGVREQGNLASSFLDASHIYGSTTERANKLRSFRNGLLLVRAQSGRGDLPPTGDEVSENCASVSSLQPCFLTGSDTTNLLPTNAALHTIWIRQHNNIAQKLRELNPHWDDERLYQEARRIVTAQIQHITYNEFLPVVIGKETIAQYGLNLRNHAFDSDYDLKVDPSTLNEYASTVGLFFFSLLPDKLAQYAETGDRVHEKILTGFYNDPSQLYLRGRLDATLRFLMRDPIRKPGLHMNTELRDNFLKGSLEHGLDLAAIIIQMGRDHGIASYTKWRSFCGLSEPRNFEELKDIVLDSINISQLEKLYDDVKDVDLFVLGLAEKPKKGALVGPTFACILGRQFQKTRRGDRFWYENFFYPSAFTEEQLNEIRKISLARIICENTDNVGKIQQNVFMLADNFGNCPVDCNTTIFENTDLKPWIDQEPKLKLPITRQTLEKAIRLGIEQYRRLQQAETGRINRAGGPPNRNSASALSTHANLMAPKKESLDIARTAAVLRETTKVLIRGEGLEESEKLPAELDVSTLQRLLPEVDVTRIIGNISDFLGPESPNRDECLPQPLPCDHTTKYRTYSGWCNNLRFPSYGNAFGPLRRLLDPAYDDGFDSPRTKSRSGRPLPSARTISNSVHQDAPNFHVKFTHMIMQFGQILDHDMTHSPIARGPGNSILNCSRCDSVTSLSIHCFPIPIERGDPHFPHVHSDGSPRCMPFTRSLLGQVTLGYRNQLNQLTSFLDASFIYGSTECEANSLRLFSQGKMNFTDLGFNKQALPQGSQERDCRSRPRHPCFNAGDERSNEQPGLTVLHTVMLREHNRIATTLNKINNFWPDEKVFQETRRVMVAKHQHIIYNEWLPVVLGCETMARYDLTPKKSGYYTGYDDRCDAAITQEISTAAFRFGHTLIRSVFPRMNSKFDKTTTPVDLKSSFNNASVMYDVAAGHMESILMGLLGTESMDYDRHIVDAVRNHLFQRPGGPLTGLDLPAINIQRARDHGVQPYNAYREMCGMSRARTFDDLRDVMDESTIRALRNVYSHVDDIDLFPGMMSERPLKGALVGPMLACVIAEQFQRLKRCDRFYYENNDPATRFTPDQLAEIRRTTMSKLICENSEYARKIQPNAFLMPDDLTNAPVSCNDLPDVDLYEWLDRQFCVVDHRVINLGKTKRITPCITCTCTAEGPECHSVVVGQCENLLNEYLFSEIMEDTVCIIQCSSLIKRRAGRL